MLRFRRDVLADEADVALEAAGRQDHRNAVGKLGEGLAQPNVARPASQKLCQPLRFEAHARRERIAGLPRDNGSAEPFEPGERVVEALPDHPLQLGVTAGALLPEALEVSVAPDDAAREVHRPSEPRPLLVDDDVGAQLPRTRRRGQAGHPSPRDDEVGQWARRARRSACARRTRA